MSRTEWMGRYRMLVQLLVQNANQSVGFAKTKKELPPGSTACAQEWQVLEYIIEHEDDEENMRSISDTLGIPKSSLTKYTKHLCELGYISGFHMDGNRKDIILKATEAGRAHYDDRVEKMMRPLFDLFFEELDGIPQEYLDQFVSALRNHNIRRAKPPAHRLIPIENQPQKPAE